MKICRKCKIEKNLEDFNKCARWPDGLQYLCRDCHREASKKDFLKHKEKRVAKFKEWKAKNYQKAAASCKAWHDAHPEKRLATGRIAALKWQKRNPDKASARESGRRASKKRAIPSWADREAIKAIFADAARLTIETGIIHHVDHIVPLNSSIVCGLHWEGNLQILPRSENLSKSNRSWPDMPDLSEAS